MLQAARVHQPVSSRGVAAAWCVRRSTSTSSTAVTGCGRSTTVRRGVCRRSMRVSCCWFGVGSVGGRGRNVGSKAGVAERREQQLAFGGGCRSAAVVCACVGACAGWSVHVLPSEQVSKQYPMPVLCLLALGDSLTHLTPPNQPCRLHASSS